MKAPPFSYHAPRSLEEALDLIGRLENSRLLAGGQSLMPMLNYRLATPDHLIDLGHIDELRGIQMKSAMLRIGAMTTQRTIEKSQLVADRCPLLIEALRHVGHQTTRNRGTIGGSVCHLDPAAELPLVAQVLEPMLTIASARGVRQIRFAEFPVSQLTSQLAADEILTSMDFPLQDLNTQTAFEEFARRPGDFAIIAVGVLVTFDDSALVKDARLAIAGTAPTAIRLNDAEQVLINHPWTHEGVSAAAQTAASQPADGDHNNPAEYRQHLVGVLTRRALQRAYTKRFGMAHG
jgi:aerobic carbon-monoxide dehydrogenase medium subunit